MRTFIGAEVYSKVMGQHMLALFNTHAEQIVKNELFVPERIRKLKYLKDFDREVQCAAWGYPTEGAYYRDASSSDAVLAVRIPVMCLHSQDDPIACDEAVPAREIEQNPYVVMVSTRSGGHLGWYEGHGKRWHQKPVS